MKRFLVALLMVSCVGCTQWKHLIGQSDKESPADIAGVWKGSIDLDGRSQDVTFILIQNGETVPLSSNGHNASFVSIDYSGTMQATVSGSIKGNDVHLVADDGSRCPNKYSIDGEYRGGTLLLNFNGDGNDVHGTSCYPHPIHQTIAMTR